MKRWLIPLLALLLLTQAVGFALLTFLTYGEE